MKKNLKLWLFAAVFLFLGCFTTSLLAATISGPEMVKPGELATVECDQEGEWIIMPKKGVQFIKDSGGKAIYFVGQKEGEYTAIFFGVVDGKPVLLLHDLTIGTPEPEPAPEPSPEPSPSPVVKNLTAADRDALAASLTFTIDCIDKGQIKTVQGARSTFRQSISAKASVCNGVSCRLKPEISEVLDAWTEEADFSTLETTRKSFEHFLETVK